MDFSALQSQLELLYVEVKEHLASARDMTEQDPHVEEDDAQECHVDAFFALFRKAYFRSMYRGVYHWIKIYRVIPVSSTSSERLFSTLRRVKTWLRSCMTEERLSDLYYEH